MTNVNASVVRIYPSTATNSAGVKYGYFVATAKAAQNDTITLTNVKTIIDANLRVATTGVAESYTMATNVLTCTSATGSTTIRGIVVYT